MEREGSGFDMMYERLLVTGRAAPRVTERANAVQVTVPRRVLHPGVLQLLSRVNQSQALTQRERITLGMLAATEGLSATELASRLGLSETGELRNCLGELVSLWLVSQSGRTRGTRYHVPPELLRASGLDLRTTLSRVEPHRLRALILEDLGRYPDSSSAQVHARVGPEIPERSFRRAMEELVEQGQVSYTGDRRWRRYRGVSSIGQDTPGGR